MKKPIIYIYTNSQEIDKTAKVLLDAGFLVAVPYTCPWSYEKLIVIPKKEIDKRGVIKGGIKYISATYGKINVILAEEYVKAEDILIVHSTMIENPEAFVLSERENPSGKGNFEKIAHKITKVLFAVVQGRMVNDMNSGVRGLPGQYLSVFYDMHGNDRDLLLGQIMALRRLNIPLAQCKAVSQGTNSAAHSVLELIKDIFRVAMLFFKFVSSSLFSTVIDLGIYTAMLHFVTESLFVSSATARVISSIVNFTLNQSVVFRNKDPRHKWKMFLKYYALVITLWTLDYLLLLLFVNVFGVNRVLAKAITGTLIYAISFITQRDFVFKHKK